MEPGRSCSSRSCHRRGLPFSRRGLTRRSLLLPREDVAQVRGGEVLQLVLVAPTDVARRHRLALPAADLHDHLQRYAPFLQALRGVPARAVLDRKSTRLNSSHGSISYAVFCLKKKMIT